MKIQKGSKVKDEYPGTLEDGTVFDTNVNKEPLEFEAGTGMMIKGFDQGVIGMKKGEEKEITLKREDAYGQPNANLTKQLPRESLPKDQEPKIDMVLVLQAPAGQQIPAKITEVNIDLNHPLAGKTLIFKVKILDVT